MNIARGALLARLNEAAIGLSSKEILEQSSCFVFTGERLITFNDSIMVRLPNPLKELCGTPDDPCDIVVAAADLLQLLSRLPDDEVKITVADGELRVKGKGRGAGISRTAEVALPVHEVPEPGKWSRLGEGVPALLQQAARICGDDEGAFLTTCVHVTPERVEASDNYRLFRADVQSGFPVEVLLPAGSVELLEKLELSKVSVGDPASGAWCHFKTAGGAVVSLRCSFEAYQSEEALSKVLKVKNGEKIVLPQNLGEIVQRAEVFHSGGYDAKVGVRVADGELTITSRKDGGWYKERKAVEYAGRELSFEINPKFLVEILTRTRDVVVDDRRIKLTSGPIQFVAALTVPTATPPTEEEPEGVADDAQQFKDDDIPL